MKKPNNKMESIHKLAMLFYLKEKKRKPKIFANINEQQFSLGFLYGYMAAFAQFELFIETKL